MLLLLLGIILLHIAALVLLFVSTIVSVSATRVPRTTSVHACSADLLTAVCVRQAWTWSETSTSDLWMNCTTIVGAGQRCDPASTGGQSRAFKQLCASKLILKVSVGAVLKSCGKCYTFLTSLENNAEIQQSFYHSDAVGVSLPPPGDLAPSREENAAVPWWRAR